MTAVLDMWSIFVIQVFGNFWLAVVGLAGLFFLILLLGRVSMYSVLAFMLVFFTCIVMGYGYGLLTIVFALFIIYRFVNDMIWVVAGKYIPG